LDVQSDLGSSALLTGVMTRSQLFPAELEEAIFKRQGVIMELLSKLLSAAQANALCNSLSRLVLLAYRTLTVAAKLHIVGKGKEAAGQMNKSACDSRAITEDQFIKARARQTVSALSTEYFCCAGKTRSAPCQAFQDMVTLGNSQYPLPGFCSCGMVDYCIHLKASSKWHFVLPCSVKTIDSGCV